MLPLGGTARMLVAETPIEHPVIRNKVTDNDIFCIGLKHCRGRALLVFFAEQPDWEHRSDTFGHISEVRHHFLPNCPTLVWPTNRLPFRSPPRARGIGGGQHAIDAKAVVVMWSKFFARHPHLRNAWQFQWILLYCYVIKFFHSTVTIVQVVFSPPGY